MYFSIRYPIRRAAAVCAKVPRAAAPRPLPTSLPPPAPAAAAGDLDLCRVLINPRITRCAPRAPGTGIDVSTDSCGEEPLVGFCPGATNIRCCPPKPSAATTAGNRCLRGQPGKCIDTHRWRCDGADALIGFCPGASHVRCCPTSASVPSDGGGSDGTDGYADAGAGDDGAGGGADAGHVTCNGGAGFCIDVDTHTCRGAATLTGLCPGDTSVRCCPTGSAAPATSYAYDDDGDGGAERPGGPPSPSTSAGTAAECSAGQAGACIDVDTRECSVATIRFKCAGPTNIRCCPSAAHRPIDPGAPAYTYDDPGSDGAGGPGPMCGTSGTKGSCVDRTTFSCSSATFVTGKCPGAVHVLCCPAPARPMARAPEAYEAYEEEVVGGGDAGQPGVGSACLSGEPGRCIDVNQRACVGGSVKSGFCPGGTNVRCCSSGESEALGSAGDAAPSPPSPAYGYADTDGAATAACLHGQAGRCIDTRSHGCAEGGSVLVGFCAGPAHIRCCTSGVTDATAATSAPPATTVAAAASTAGPKGDPECSAGVAGVCVDVNAYACSERTLVGACAGPAHIRCCPSGVSSPRGTDDDNEASEPVMADATGCNPGALIAPHEGLRKCVYKDNQGFRTIGIGFNLDQGGTFPRQFITEIGADFDAVLAGEACLTEAQVQAVFTHTVSIAEASARAIVSSYDGLCCGVREVMVDLAFNMGAPTFRTFKTLVGLVDAGEYEEAGEDLKRTKYCAQVGPRCTHNANLIAAGCRGAGSAGADKPGAAEVDQPLGRMLPALTTPGVVQSDKCLGANKWWDESRQNCYRCGSCEGNHTHMLSPCSSHSDTVCHTCPDGYYFEAAKFERDPDRDFVIRDFACHRCDSHTAGCVTWGSEKSRDMSLREWTLRHPNWIERKFCGSSVCAGKYVGEWTCAQLQPYWRKYGYDGKPVDTVDAGCAEHDLNFGPGATHESLCRAHQRLARVAFNGIPAFAAALVYSGMKMKLRIDDCPWGVKLDAYDEDVKPIFDKTGYNEPWERPTTLPASDDDDLGAALASTEWEDCIKKVEGGWTRDRCVKQKTFSPTAYPTEAARLIDWLNPFSYFPMSPSTVLYLSTHCNATHPEGCPEGLPPPPQFECPASSYEISLGGPSDGTTDLSADALAGITVPACACDANHLCAGSDCFFGLAGDPRSVFDPDMCPDCTCSKCPADHVQAGGRCVPVGSGAADDAAAARPELPGAQGAATTADAESAAGAKGGGSKGNSAHRTTVAVACIALAVVVAVVVGTAVVRRRRRGSRRARRRLQFSNVAVTNGSDPKGPAAAMAAVGSTIKKQKSVVLRQTGVKYVIPTGPLTTGATNPGFHLEGQIVYASSGNDDSAVPQPSGAPSRDGGALAVESSSV